MLAVRRTRPSTFEARPRCLTANPIEPPNKPMPARVIFWKCTRELNRGAHEYASGERRGAKGAGRRSARSKGQKRQGKAIDTRAGRPCHSLRKIRLPESNAKQIRRPKSQ